MKYSPEQRLVASSLVENKNDIAKEFYLQVLMCCCRNRLVSIFFWISDTLLSQLDSEVDVLIRAKVLRYWNAVEVLGIKKNRE